MQPKHALQFCDPFYLEKSKQETHRALALCKKRLEKIEAFIEGLDGDHKRSVSHDLRMAQVNLRSAKRYAEEYTKRALVGEPLPEDLRIFVFALKLSIKKDIEEIKAHKADKAEIIDRKKRTGGGVADLSGWQEDLSTLQTNARLKLLWYAFLRGKAYSEVESEHTVWDRHTRFPAGLCDYNCLPKGFDVLTPHRGEFCSWIRAEKY